MCFLRRVQQWMEWTWWVCQWGYPKRDKQTEGDVHLLILRWKKTSWKTPNKEYPFQCFLIFWSDWRVNGGNVRLSLLLRVMSIPQWTSCWLDLPFKFTLLSGGSELASPLKETFHANPKLPSGCGLNPQICDPFQHVNPQIDDSFR